MALSDEEVRHFAIELLTAPTARDAQRRIGASNLSNGCDYCLAANMLGDMRETPMLDRAWGGRILGTAIHHVMEERLSEAKEAAHNELSWLGRKDFNQALLAIGRRYPDARIEEHISSKSVLGSYGGIGTTPDLVLPGECHAFDWKGTTKKKSALMRDFLGQTKFGRSHKDVKLSENEYAKEMLKMEFTVTKYYSQLQTYMRVLRENGTRIDRASIVFISRDDTMWYDNPSQAGYDDVTKMRGVWTLSFDWNEAFAEAVWNRGTNLWERLQAGEPLENFTHHPQCYPCGLDQRDAIKAAKEAAEALDGATLTQIVVPTEQKEIAA